MSFFIYVCSFIRVEIFKLTIMKKMTTDLLD